MWTLFAALVGGVLFLDLFVLHRKAHEVRMREAAVTGGSFVALALAFCGFVAWKLGAAPAQEFLTGYVVELSLSFDNLFVFLVLFKFFGVEAKHQHRVLFWGILGALVLRALFIVAGSALLQRFSWLAYAFGLFLVLTGAKLLAKDDDEADPSQGFLMRTLRRLVPVSSAPHEGRFFVVEGGKRLATTLFLCLLMVEASDVVFAVDSIPAIFGITVDPFIVYTSNVFAILGLRSFFVLLALLMAAFRYLNVGLAFVLMFIGAKMVAVGFDFHLGSMASLAVVFGILGAAVVASLVRRPKAGGAGSP
ncbi:MAG: TerC/Alx family metal homeostasis membrane protein [Planctomycetes bacterium]|nr:TerC/Alx family metal homeostasis membrane protein [Planctomycetota bacterium]